MAVRRVLFVLEYFPPHIGGVETLFRNLTTGLVRRGLQVTVVTLRLPGTPREETMDGVTVRRVAVPMRLRRYTFMAAALPLASREAARADVLHTTTYNAPVPAFLAGRLRGRPVVMTVHEVFGKQWNALVGMHPLMGYPFRAYERALMHLPIAHFIADSDFTRGRLIGLMGVDPARATTVYPALDHEPWDPARHRPHPATRALGRFVYLYFGRPGLSKGVEYLVRAAATVKREVPDSRLVMILADDPADHYARLLAEVRAAGLSGHVVVLDPVPRAELPSHLLAADCVVVPSVSEGFGYSALEAATLGRPVVATSGHSVEEILGGAVRLVPPRDPDALAAAIVDVARHPAALPPPRRFSIESHIDGVLAVYDRVARERA
jgi:glycosyltransferase involved in cell wall biosynthesis